MRRLNWGQRALSAWRPRARKKTIGETENEFSDVEKAMGKNFPGEGRVTKKKNSPREKQN